jgi:hypothetical protein
MWKRKTNVGHERETAQVTNKAETENAKATVTAETEETTAALVQVGNGFPVTNWAEPNQLDDEQLATMVNEGAVRLAVFSEALKPYYLELRERFHKKSDEALIHGCKTWNEYCEKVLDRTRRAINYWLAGGNPSEKRNSRKNGTKEQGTREAPEGDGAHRPKLTQQLATIPTTDTADWTDNAYVKTCVDFFESTLRPLESDPQRFHRVAVAIAQEILGDMGNEQIVERESELAAVNE